MLWESFVSIPDLLKIAARVKNPKFKLLILGGDFSAFKTLAKKLKLDKKLIVKSNVQDIGNYINASDVGVYTSDTESFGMAMLESMSYGKTVLATRAGGVPEVVENGKTGFLFKVGDVNGFSKKLEWLIKNKNVTEKMGAEAKTAACKKFCSGIVVPRYAKYYESVLKK